MNTWKTKLFVVVLAGAGLLWGCTEQALSETPASPSPTVAEASATPEEVATEEVSVTTAVPDQTLTPGMGGPGRGRGQGQGPAHAGQGPGGPPEGRGPDNPWRAFHQMPVPEEYASLTQPMPGTRPPSSGARNCINHIAPRVTGRRAWATGRPGPL